VFGPWLVVPPGYLVASRALSHTVVATRRVVTVGSFAATCTANSKGGAGAGGGVGGSGGQGEGGRGWG